MQSHILSLIALLAPLPAAAFGDLDCITFESCANGGCGPEMRPFSVAFNWSDEIAVVTADSTEYALPWASSGQSDESLSTVIEYGDLNSDAQRLLRIEANATNITAYYTFTAPSTQTWVATCNVRQAA